MAAVDYHTGDLLVATPVIEDPNFARSVVLLLDHDEDGALGVVLNRPSDVAVTDVLPSWDELAVDPPVVFGGGPVQPDAIVALARARPGVDRGEEWQPITGRLRLIDLREDPALAAAEVEVVRVFAGYAGWAPGQLEAELDEEAWVTVGTEPDDPFSRDPDELWARVLRRQPGEVKLLSTYPEQPWAN